MVKQIGILVAALACAAPAAVLAQGADTAPQQGTQAAPQGTQQGQQGTQQGAQGAKIALPPGAKLVGTAELDQLRAFPEQQSAKAKGPQEEIVGQKATDRVFETDRAYPDVVKFFDQQAMQGGNTQKSRDTTSTSTAWTIHLPQGKTVNVVVRNTHPTTFEIVAASDVSTESQPGGAPAR